MLWWLLHLSLRHSVKSIGLLVYLQRAKASIGGGLGGQVLPWTVQEDRLLCAVVHEFGSNWLLVADVLASSTHLQGIYRKPKQCAERFKQLSVSGQCIPMSSPWEPITLSDMPSVLLRPLLREPCHPGLLQPALLHI